MQFQIKINLLKNNTQMKILKRILKLFLKILLNKI